MAVFQKKVAVIANLLKRNGKPIAKDVSVEFTLPAFARGEMQNSGTDETPLLMFDGAMEAKITGKGIDKSIVDLGAPILARYKLTEVQQINLVEGAPAVEQVEFVFNGKGAGPVSHSSSVGEGSDAEYTLVLNRYQEFLNGEETVCIDRDLGICRINGVDYFAAKNAMLI